MPADIYDQLVDKITVAASAIIDQRKMTLDIIVLSDDARRVAKIHEVTRQSADIAKEQDIFRRFVALANKVAGAIQMSRSERAAVADLTDGELGRAILDGTAAAIAKRSKAIAIHDGGQLTDVDPRNIDLDDPRQWFERISDTMRDSAVSQHIDIGGLRPSRQKLPELDTLF